MDKYPVNPYTPIRSIEQLQQAMSTHDWTYHFSDDHRVWAREDAVHQRIRSGSQWLRDNGHQSEVDALWERYAKY